MRAKTAMLLTIVALMLGGLFTVASPAVAAAQPDKVTVCHKPGTPAEHEITMSERALPAHLAHGDVVGPCGPPAPQPQPCNAATQSGGAGVTTTVHELGVSGPTSFLFQWEAYGIPDQFQVYYEGNLIYDTGVVGDDINEGTGSATVTVPAGTSSTVTVVVTGPSGTAWQYTVNCP